MKQIICLLMLLSFLASCTRALRPAASAVRRPPASAGAKAPMQDAPQPAGEEKPLLEEAGIRRYYLNVDGDTRTFLVQLPQGYTASATYPVAFFFHSIHGRDTSWIKNRGANDYIDKQGYIAIYAQGANGGVWNVGGNYPFKKVSEPHFVQAMYTWLQRYAKIDTKKVFAIGSSNGAILVHYLAIQMNLFTAVASISGSLYTDEMKSGVQPVAMLQVHGTIDKTVPYDGGYNPWGYTFLSAQNTAKEWARVNGCNGQPAVSNLLDNKVTAYTYSGCNPGKPVVLYSLAGVPHKVMQSFDADWIFKEIFEFFRENS